MARHGTPTPVAAIELLRVAAFIETFGGRFARAFADWPESLDDACESARQPLLHGLGEPETSAEAWFNGGSVAAVACALGKSIWLICGPSHAE